MSNKKLDSTRYDCMAYLLKLANTDFGRLRKSYRQINRYTISPYDRKLPIKEKEVNILEALLLSEIPLYVMELKRRLKMHYTQVHRAVKKLEKLGFVKNYVGSKPHVRASRRFPSIKLYVITDEGALLVFADRYPWADKNRKLALLRGLERWSKRVYELMTNFTDTKERLLYLSSMIHVITELTRLKAPRWNFDEMVRLTLYRVPEVFSHLDWWSFLIKNKTLYKVIINELEETERFLKYIIYPPHLFRRVKRTIRIYERNSRAYSEATSDYVNRWVEYCKEYFPFEQGL